MTVGELKEMIMNVPDEFTLGQTKTETINENFFGKHTNTYIQQIDVHPIVDLKEKTLILKIKKQ